MQRYDAFCSAVTRALRDATAGERAAVGRELREHLEDHAAALIEGGMDAEDAATCNRLIDDYCKTHNIDYETCNYLLKFVN